MAFEPLLDYEPRPALASPRTSWMGSMPPGDLARSGCTTNRHPDSDCCETVLRCEPAPFERVSRDDERSITQGRRSECSSCRPCLRDSVLLGPAEPIGVVSLSGALSVDHCLRQCCVSGS